jgi:hypothetical protein
VKSLTSFYSFLLKEEIAPQETFSVARLRELAHLDEIHDYVKSTLKEKLGEGATREVWAINDKQVIKLVQLEGNAYQNRNEVNHIECLGSSYAPVVFAYDKFDFLWIIEERLQPATGPEISNKLEELIGHKFHHGDEIMYFFAGIRSRKGFSPLFSKLYNESPWLKKLADEIKTCDVDSHDFHEENWGIRPSTGELILLDLGF